MTSEKLALLGGPKAVTKDPGDLLAWPIITKEAEDAVLEVLRAGKMSGTDVTEQFEAEFAAWQGTPYALAHPSGTTAIQAAMFGCGVGRGDEVICPSITFWASGLPALSLGATLVWADIERATLCLDPADLEKRITGRTRLIVLVHYAGYPADVEAVVEIARPSGIKVLEDVSHAHGAICNGRKAGMIGDVGAMSMMSGKSFVIGEGGMLVTADREIYERAIAWGMYRRHKREGLVTRPELRQFAGLPMGGVKNRLNQLASALGRVALREYDGRNAEILEAMNYFWDGLEGTPGVRAHRPPPGSASRMGGWYTARGLYDAERLGGLPLARFCEAVSAEGCPVSVGANSPLHLHPLVNEADIYGDGRPTVVAQADGRDPRAPVGSLPVAEAIFEFCFGVPWFKHHRPELIDEYAAAIQKVVAHADELTA